jgi:hypothetical protein
MPKNVRLIYRPRREGGALKAGPLESEPVLAEKSNIPLEVNHLNTQAHDWAYASVRMSCSYVVATDDSMKCGHDAVEPFSDETRLRTASGSRATLRSFDQQHVLILGSNRRGDKAAACHDYSDR